jgi:hypothetical protein
MALTDKLTAIADGFRASRGTSPKYSLDHMAILAAEPLLYTNVILDSIDSTGEIFNGKGWADNSRIGSGKLDSYIGNGLYYITGYIAIDPAIDNTIRMKNVTFNYDTTISNIGLAYYDANFARAYPLTGSTINWTEPSYINTNSNGYDKVLDGTNIVQFTLKNGVHIDNPAVKYIAICAEYIGNDSVITINQALSAGGGDTIPDGTDVTFGYENGAPVEREEAYAISSTELNELGKIVQGVANAASLLTIADMNYWLLRAKFVSQAYANTEIPATSQRLVVKASGELQEA